MRPFLITLATILLGCALVACHSAVRFKPHAPYNAPRRFAQPLIIVHPDGIDEWRDTASVGGFLRPRKFRVHYGEAIKWETVARFGNMFSGVFLINHTDYANIQTDPGGDSVNVYSLPENLIEPQGYVLYLERVRFEIDGGRPRYFVDLSFSNRATGVELFRGTMRGSGQSITVRESTDYMLQELTRSVVSATNSLLNPLAERVRRAIAEEPPPPAPQASQSDEQAEPESAEESAEDGTPDDGTAEEGTGEEEAPTPHPRLKPFFVTPE